MPFLQVLWNFRSLIGWFKNEGLLLVDSQIHLNEGLWLVDPQIHLLAAQNPGGVILSEGCPSLSLWKYFFETWKQLDFNYRGVRPAGVQ